MVLFFEGNVIFNNQFRSPTANVDDWTAFQIDFDSYVEADSATLMIFNFYPSTQTDGPNGNSVLWIDNLNFNSLISGVSILAMPSEFAIYPNPTTGQVKVKLNGTNTSSSTLVVYNVLGEVVLSQALQQ